VISILRLHAQEEFSTCFSGIVVKLFPSIYQERSQKKDEKFYDLRRGLVGGVTSDDKEN
jgi:hypothetical protein